MSASEVPAERVLLNIQQVCDRLGVTRRTVYNWMQTGKLDWVVTPSGTRRIYLDSLVKAPGLLTASGARVGRPTKLPSPTAKRREEQVPWPASS